MLQEGEKKVERRPGRVQGGGSLTWVSGVYPVIVVLLVLSTWTIAWAQFGHAPRLWPVANPLLAWGALVGLAHRDLGSVLKWLVD